MRFSINRVIALSAILAVIIAGFIYSYCYGLEFVQALYYSFTVFSLDIKNPSYFGLDDDFTSHWKWIYLAGGLAIISLFLTVTTLYIKFLRHDGRLWRILNKSDHIIVIGLGESNRVYIDSELKYGNNNIVVVEHDKNNPYLEKYKEKIGVIIGEGQDIEVLNGLNYHKSKQVVISTSDDMINIEIATQLLSLDSSKKMFIHIEDRNLRYFHKKNGILSGEDVKVYSYYEDTARELFSKYSVDGEGYDIIRSNKSYSIGVIGDTLIAYEVIAQASIMGQLPNENELTIYCVDKNVKKFQENIELHFPEIINVPNVIVEYVELDPHTNIFYKHDLWKKKMTNIIVCFEEDQKNLDIASNLLNNTFSFDIAEKKMKTNILIALFKNYNLNYLLNSNHQVFRYLYSFGNINEINKREYVVSDKRDKIAIATNFIYNSVDVSLVNNGNKNANLVNYDNFLYKYKLYLEDDKKTSEEYTNKEKNLIEKYNKDAFVETDESGWSDLSYFKKESNRSVADQIRMKLKYLGLKIVESNERNKEVLFENNKKIYRSKLKSKNLLPTKDEILLAKMEHNRWSAFHFINGYKKMDFVTKKVKKDLEEIHEAKKEHMCLIKFPEFKTRKNELNELGYKTGQFEGYDFMINAHMALILANAGYAIKIPKKLGVTGHRTLNSKHYIGQKLENELKKLSVYYKFDKIISPLADGADRLVAELLTQKYDADLLAILPFQEKLYIDTFIGNKKDEKDKKLLEKSQKEFSKLLKSALDIRVLGEIELIEDKDNEDEKDRKNNHRDECYFNVGKEVVDQCDILIVLWDGVEADGVSKIGGTAYVMKYAKEQRKSILYINTKTLKVELINFDELI